MRRLAAMIVTCLAAGGAMSAHAQVADFQDLVLGPNSYWNGSADPAAGGFTTGTVFFNNSYVVDEFSGWAFWGGWAYSNMTDTTTPGYGNQYSAIAGGGHSGGNYGVAYVDTYAPTIPTIRLPQPTVLQQACVTNTTYAYFDMRDGSAFSKKFGGATGDDPDWFLLTITGKNTQGQETGTVRFYLADFRFADNAQDYIVDDWTPVDLRDLKAVTSVEFTLSSSDSGAWGMNTPAYFAMDTLTLVPEPGTLVLVAGGVVALTLRRRRPPAPLSPHQER